MAPNTWVAKLVVSRSVLILVALLTTSTGVGLLIDRPKATVLEWLGVPLIVLGGGLLTWALWPFARGGTEGPPSLATQFLRRLTLDGRLVQLFPAMGVGLIAADLAYNWTLSSTPALQTEDTIVLLAAATLLGYVFVPARFARERDFVLLFFLWLNAILVIPLMLSRLYYSDFEGSVDVYSWVALAPETSFLLNLIGVNNQVHAVVGSTAPGLTFTPQHVSIQVTVVITTACSGIYSFGIFGSAFIAFVLTEYRSLSRPLWLLLGLGILTAYVANVLRMAIIVLVGYYTDSAQTDLQNMLIAHSYAGWLIFLGWVALFWGIILKVVPGERGLDATRVPKTGSHRLESLCAICSNFLSPAIPATRCVCGRYYHLSCFRGAGRCPSCGLANEIDTGGPSVVPGP
jgi:exosortase/archaeosortase family protein